VEPPARAATCSGGCPCRAPGAPRPPR
jgi:hypothetical protein